LEDGKAAAAAIAEAVTAAATACGLTPVEMHNLVGDVLSPAAVD
jgi:hypothetical protein